MVSLSERGDGCETRSLLVSLFATLSAGVLSCVMLGCSSCFVSLSLGARGRVACPGLDSCLLLGLRE